MPQSKFYHLARFTHLHRMEKMFEIIAPLIVIKEGSHIIDGGCSSGASTARIGVELAPTVRKITGIDLVDPGLPNPKEKIPDFDSVLSEYDEQPELVGYIKQATTFVRGDLFFPSQLFSKGVEKADVLIMANNLLNRLNALSFKSLYEVKKILLVLSELLIDEGYLVLWSDSSYVDEEIGHEYSCIVWQKKDDILYLVGDDEFYAIATPFKEELDELKTIST